MRTRSIISTLFAIMSCAFVMSFSVCASDIESDKSPERDSIIIGSDTNDTLKLESRTEIGDIIEIEPHAARVCDRLGEYGEKSGDKNEFLVVDLDICNISKDIINLDDLIGAELFYKDDYQFSQYTNTEINERDSFLYGKWEGINDEGGMRKIYAEFTETNADGFVVGIIRYEPYEYDGDYLNDAAGSFSIKGKYDDKWDGWKFEPVEWIENVDGRGYLNYYLRAASYDVLSGAGYNGGHLTYLVRTDLSDQTNELDVLEETSYSLVFKCPNRVINDLDNCSLYISVDDEVYEIPLH